MKRTFGMALLFAMGTAFGAASQPEPVLPQNKLDPAAFPALAALIRGEMVRGGRFEFVKEKERLTVEASLQEIENTLAGRQSVSELSEAEKVAVLNAQEQVNGILARRDRDRLICERRVVVGSHFPQTVCETYGEKVVRTEQARKQYKEYEDVILQKPVDPDQR